MVHAFQSELFRLRKRPQTWVIPALTVGFIAIYYVILFLVYQFDPTSNRTDLQESFMVSNIFEHGMLMLIYFGVILTAIMASSLIGSEYSWNTLRPLVARASSRSSLLSAKWATLLLYTMLIVIVAVMSAITLSVLTSVLVNNPISLSVDLWDDFLVGTVRWIGALLPYSAVAFTAALLARSNATGIAIGIGVYFVEPLVFELLKFVSDVAESIQKYGIEWNARQLMSISTQDDGGGFMDPVEASQVWQSAGIIAVYVTIFVAVSYVVFNRRDITSG